MVPTSPYEFGSAIQSIQPILGSPNANAPFSNIGGGLGNKIDVASTLSNIGGGASNTITGSTVSVINGGSINNILDSDYTSIVGGKSNVIKNDSTQSSIVGGLTNMVLGGSKSIIGAGELNMITGTTKSIIGAGDQNKIFDSEQSNISAGKFNKIIENTWYSHIGAGTGNVIKANSTYNAIAAGGVNLMTNSSSGNRTAYSFIGAGSSNILSGASYSTIVSGINNKIVDTGDTPGAILTGQYNLIKDSEYTAIINGKNNTINGLSFDSSAVIGADDRVVDRDHTTFMEGLDVDSNRGGVTNAQAFKYHGTFADPGINRVLTDIDGLGNAVWIDIGVVSSDPNCAIVSATSNNCILTLINCTGGTITADTCNTFGSVSPYEIGTGAQSIQPILGSPFSNGNFSNIGGGVGNVVDSQLSNIGGGSKNEISTTSGYSFIGGGGSNTVNNSTYSGVLVGSNNTISNANSGAIINGGDNSVVHLNSAIIGSSGLLTNRTYTTFMEGLDVNTARGGGGNAQAFKYHGTFASPGLPPSGGNKFLADIDGLGNAVWMDLPGVPPVSGSDCYVTGATTLDCVTTFELSCSGLTYTANTCNGEWSPYRATGVNAIVPTVPGAGAGNTNSIDNSSFLSNVGGGQSNRVISSSRWSNIGGGVANTITDSPVSSILGGHHNTVNLSSTGADGYGAIVNGFENTVNHIYSAIIGGMNITTNRTFTTFMEGLDVNTNRANGSVDGQAFKYHGTFADPGNNRVLTSVDNLGNAVWKDSGIVHIDCPIISAYTSNSGCTLNLIDCSGNTFTASTCNTFPGPYRIGSGINSIEPTIAGLGASSAAAYHSNIQGGYNNDIDVSSVASAIVGGAQHTITGSYDAFVGAGMQNNISGSHRSSIVGGYYNDITNCPDSYIGGGMHNKVFNSSAYSSIVGGYNNMMSGSSMTTIVGGTSNVINDSNYSNIGGGSNNLIKENTASSSITNGQSNIISASTYSSIVGGTGGVIEGTLYGSIIGGQNNHIHSADLSTIINGHNNNINHDHSVILGTANRTTSLSYTTYLDGLDIDSVGQGGARYLKYHGALANPGLGKILTSIDNLGNAVWRPGGIVQSDPNCAIVSATSNNCVLTLINCTGGTITADTCNTFGSVSPYEYGSGVDSIQPILDNNLSDGDLSNIGGGTDNHITSIQTTHSNIGGGESNYITKSIGSFIGGGKDNDLDGAGYSSVVGGYNNNITGSAYSGILSGIENNINIGSMYSAIVNGYGNTISSHYSAIIGGANLTTNRQYTTFMEGLDVDTNRGGATNAQAFKYHGTFASPGINKVLTDVDGFGNAVWMDLPGFPSVTGCSITGVTVVDCVGTYFTDCGTTITADTCDGSYSPYRPTGGVNSITTTVPVVGPNENLIDGTSNYSTISAGFRNEITGSSWSNVVGGLENVIKDSLVSTIITGRDCLIEMPTINNWGHSVIVNGGYNVSNHTHSVIMGAENITTDRPHTVFMNGLDVFTTTNSIAVGTTEQPLRYHGTFADPGINRVLTDIDGLGNAVWTEPPGVVNLTGDEFVTSASTNGCILTLITNSGNTITADTCSTFSGPYKVGLGTNSIEPTYGSFGSSTDGDWSNIGGGANNHVDVNSLVSNISGGDRNKISGTTWANIDGGYSNIIKNASSLSSILGGANNLVDNSMMSTILGGSLNSVENSTRSTILNGLSNKMSGTTNSVIAGSGGVTAYLNNTVYTSKIQAHGKVRLSSIEYNNTNSLNSVDPKMTLEVIHDTSTIDALVSDTSGGEIVRFGGAGTGYATGALVQLRGGTWELAKNTDTTKQGNMLGIALGSRPSDEGVLIRGFSRPNTFSSIVSSDIGQPIYVGATSGMFTTTVPTASGTYLRVVGYQVRGIDAGIPIYFNPESTYITVV